MAAALKMIRLERVALALMVIILLLAVLQPTVRSQAQTGSVGGTVYAFTCRGDIVPLSGATVVATLIQTGYTSQPITTGPTGSFNLTLPPGEYKLFVTADFFKTQDSYSFTIASGTALKDFNFYLDSKTSTYCQLIQYQNHLDTFVVYSNASASNVVYDSNKRMINFTIEIANTSVTRFLIVVPRMFIDGAPVVSLDNLEIASVLIEGSNYYFAKAEGSVGSHNATVRGSMTIPEISTQAQLLVTALCLTFSVFILSELKSGRRRNTSSITRFLQHHDNPSIIGIPL